MHYKSLLAYLAVSLIAMAGPVVQSHTQQANTPKPKIDTLGPYRLGSEYKDLQSLTGFTEDPKRSEPEKNIKAARIISESVFNVPTIQRLIFQNDRLIRVSLIFGPSELSEEHVRDAVAKQWGDPGPKISIGDSLRYVWKGEIGTIIILPADGGRHMASLVAIEK